ncbi:hypothetical protein GINT2_000460 [Glugoides intestinalis]
MFSQISITVSILSILSRDLEYDIKQLLYKGKTIEIEDCFDVVVNTFNDAIFGTFNVVLTKHTKLFGNVISETKLVGSCIYIRDIIKIRTMEKEYDLIAIDDLLSADYFDKNPPLHGRIRFNFTIKTLDKSFKEEVNNSFGRKIMNSIFSADLANSFVSINELTSFISQGSAFCNLKSFLGMLIVDTILMKKLACTESSHEEMNGCFIKYCIKNYDLRPRIESENALRQIEFCIGSYLDSTLWNFLVKTDNKKPEIKDMKLRAVLERINIPESDFIKYFDGSHTKVGFILFVDKDTLVIGFRGTLSHYDLINDLDGNYSPFLTGYAHSGILKLVKSFIETEFEFITTILKERSLKKVLLVGHSLGGGVASLLHLMLMDSGLLSDYAVNTVTFASPPTVSQTFINQEVENLVTYNYGDDIIPKLSVGSLLDFKYMCLSMANSYKVFSKSEEMLEKLVSVRKYLRESNINPKLYQPGTVYHIKSDKTSNSTKYGFKRVNPEFFAELIYFKDFPTDHILKKHIEAFKYCINMEK